jgi:glycosyltransferase involved in cell wall biosynthesis
MLNKFVDIIVYLYSDEDRVKECLEAIVCNSTDHNLVIINDNLGSPITKYLLGFSSLHPCLLIENLDTLGFSRSVNKAIRASYSPYLVVLDSRTIVSKDWLGNMLEAINVDDATGVVAPLLDTDIYGTENPPFNLEMTATIVENASGERFPVLSLEKRPCLMIKRSLFNRTGLLNESVDRDAAMRELCFKVTKQGVLTRIADHCCVSSKADGTRIIDPDFQQVIKNIQQLSSSIDLKAVFDKSILFLLPLGKSRDALMDEVTELRRCGINVHAAVLKEDDGPLDLSADIVVATDHISVRYLKRLMDKGLDITPMYYIQDYEVWSFPRHDLKRTIEAAQSYTLIPSMVLFTKTRWLCDVVKAWHGIDVFKITLGLDKSIFYAYSTRPRRITGPIRITAIVRPRDFIHVSREILNILKIIKNRYKGEVDIRVFGCADEELDLMEESRGFRFVNLGELKKEEVVELLRGCDIFVDSSPYQDLGCTGLEAMAVGCAAVLPGNCGSSEYAQDRENCLITDVEDRDGIVSAVETLIEDKRLLAHVKEQGIKTARAYSLRKTIWSEILLFRRVL